MPTAIVNLFFGDSSYAILKEFYSQANYRAEDFLPYSDFICLKTSNQQSERLLFQNFKKNETFDPRSEEDIEEDFKDLYNNYYNIAKNVSIVQFNLLISLGDFSNQQLIFKSLESLSGLIKREQLSISINLFIVAGDLTNVFDYETIPVNTQISNFRLLKDFVDKQEISCLKVLLENKNTEGKALNLNRDDFARVLCEINSSMTFYHSEIFNSLLNSKGELTSLGYSTLYYDSNFLREYLNSQSYIFLVEKEGIGKDEIIGIKEIAKEAKEILDPYADLFKCFKEKYLIDSDKNIGLVENNLDKYTTELLNGIQEKMLHFIHNNQFSIYRKRAVLAYIIGEDDDLLEGYNQFNDLSFIRRITLDDCENSVAVFFFNLMEKTDNWVSLEEIKDKRQIIQESKAYIKNLTSEINSLSANIDNLNSNTKIFIEGKNSNSNDIRNHIFYPLILSTRRLQENYQKKISSLASSIDLRSGFSVIEDPEFSEYQDVSSIISVYDYLFSNSAKKIRFSSLYLNSKIEKLVKANTSYDYIEVINILSESGICQKSTFTKEEEEMNNEADQEAMQFALKKALNIDADETKMKSALNEGLPIIINLKVFESFRLLENNKTGIVSYPTKEEIDKGTSLSHTFVLCGYSTEEKFFIAKPSFGNEFANKGFCFLPFNYVLNTEFLQYAYLFAEINGLDSSVLLISPTNKNKEIFNVQEAGIRSAISKNKLLIEQQNQATLQTKYKRKRINYEQQIVEIGNPKLRETLTNKGVLEINERINEYQKKTDITTQEITEDIIRVQKFRILEIIGLLGFSISLIYLFFKPEATWVKVLMYSCLVIFIFSLLKIISIKFEIKSLKKLVTDLQKEIANLKMEIETFRLKSKICAALLDDFVEFKALLIKKYSQFRDLILNLQSWHEKQVETSNTFENYKKGPFFPIIDTFYLNSYFNKTKSNLLNDMYLTDYFKLNSVNSFNNEELIKTFRKEINKLLDERLINHILQNFDIIEYISKEKIYEYLPDPSKIAKFADLQRCAKPFVQLNNEILKMEQYSWFLISDANNQVIRSSIKSDFNPSPVIIRSDNLKYQITFIEAVGYLEENQVRFFQIQT